MARKIQVDEIDMKILSYLKNNARIQWREIGEEIHMTGQAVGERIKKLTKLGIIKGYYTSIDQSCFEPIIVNFITVIMASSDHKGFLMLIESLDQVTEVYKTSGHGCYLLRVETTNNDCLEELLDKILQYGNYRVSSVINQYK